jgi:hypothetical protein
MDVMEWDGHLVAVADAPGSPFLSDDGSLTWKALAEGEGELDAALAPLADGLLILTGEAAYLCQGPGRLNRRRLEVMPGSEVGYPHRLTPFRGGVVYTRWDNWGRRSARTHPLFYLKDARADVQLIECFKDRVVRDVQAEGDTLYVLTAKTEGEDFRGEIHATRDLRDWVRLAAFTVPALPNALAQLDGRFYVGLANRGCEPAREGHDDDPFTYAFAAPRPA